MNSETTNKTVSDVLNKKNRKIKKLKKKNRKLKRVIDFLLKDNKGSCIIDYYNYCGKYKNCTTCIYRYIIKSEKKNDK